MAAADLNELTLQRERVERRLATQYAVTRVLAESADLATATHGILEAICSTLDWEFGALWTVDAASQRIRCVDIWHTADAQLPQFSAATRTLSLSPGQGIPGRVWQSRQPTWVPDVLQDDSFVRSGAASEEGLRSAFAFPVANGSTFHGVLEFFSTAIREPDEPLLRMIRAAGDQIGLFMERRRAEEALRFQNSLLEAQNEAAIDGILIVSSDAKILSYNQRFVDMWRIPLEVMETGSSDAAIAVVINQLADPDHFMRRTQEMYRQLDQRSRDEIKLANGRVFERYSAPVRSSEGEFYGRALYFRDVTEQKRADEAQRFLIQANTELDASLDFETTLGNVARLALGHFADWCAVSLVEPDGSIRRVATDHIDPTRAALLREFQERYVVDPASRHPVAEVIRTGVSQLNPKVPEERMLAVAPDQGHIDMVRELGMLSSMVVPLRASGQTIGAISIVSGRETRQYDERDLRLAEDLGRSAALAVVNARLFQQAQEALQLRDEFMAAASHDLKGPLATIKGLAQLLARFVRRDPIEREKITDGLSAIDGATNKMTSLINQLLDVSRVEMGHPLDLDLRPTDLVALTQRVVQDQRYAADRHRITYRHDEPTIQVICDPERAERVVTNLLSNAVKYSPGNSEIDVVVRPATDDEASEPSAVIQVRDRGAGIPAADIPRVFDHFHRARNVKDRVRGSGIGLASVKQIVTQHGGRVEVESEEGRGSLFTVVLPLEAIDPQDHDA